MRNVSDITKKKLLIYFPSIERGGVEKNFFNLINDTNFKNQFDFKIITFNNDDNRLKKYRNSIIAACKFKTKLRLIKYIYCFLLLLKISKKNDLILSFQNSVFSIIASKLKKSNIIIRLNTAPQKYVKNILYKIFFKFFYKYSTYIICNSIEFKKQIKKYFSLDAIYINNFCNIKKIKKLSKIKIKFNFFKKFNGIKIISIGRLVDQKNHMLSLIALNKIRNKLNFRYLIIGSGKKHKELNDFINKKKLNDKIKIINYKNNPYNFLKMSDIFLLPSKFEGYPNVLIEAILLKKYFLSSDCSTGPKEIKNLNKNFGNLFKNDNPSSLISKFLKIINKKKHLKIKKINTEVIIRKKFGNNTNIINLLNNF